MFGNLYHRITHIKKHTLFYKKRNRNLIKPIGLIKNNVLYYIHNDHLGRTERITNQSKGVVWKANNYDYNRTVTQNSIGAYNLGFPGQCWDVEKGSWYNYFRDYDSTTGRYLQIDPIGLAWGVNTYGYVGVGSCGVCGSVGVTMF